MDLRSELFSNEDVEYKKFHSGLIPTVSSDKIIGVRMPVLRKIAKKAFKENADNECYYYEEIVVKGLTLAMKKCSAQEHISDLKQFVPLIDNWACCDMCCSAFKFTEKNLQDYFEFIISYVGKSEFETRFSVVMLMDYYLNDVYIDRVIEILLSINSDEYYVNMAIAWALSVIYVKYKFKILPVFESQILNAQVQNKAIQKIRESYRVSKEDKEYLKQFKIR